MPQVSNENYAALSYDHLQRWISYWYQIQAVARHQPETVLEIGVGTGEVTNYLRHRLNLKTTTFDFAEDVHPDVVGDIRELRSHFQPDSFDTVCAFQVLEHIPFENFETCLQQMSEVARQRVIISLPYSGYFLQFRLRFLLYKWSMAFGRKIGIPKDWRFNGQHYWEIGTRQTPLHLIQQSVSQILYIEKEYFCPDYPYHYFFETCVKHPE